jgi:endonuclease/exonuclease/phosphatase family metal-dependent hydrolase
VTVAVAHLQAGASTEAAMVRQVQVHQLLEALPEGPCVLVGDLNVHRDDPLDAESLLSLAEAGFVELVPEHRDKGTSRYGAHRFDRLFVRDGPVVHWQPQRARVLRDEDWSDHFPVTARLRRKRPR